MFKPILLSCLLSFAHLAPNCQAAVYTTQNAVYQPIEPKTISKKKLTIRKKIQQKQQESADPYVILALICGAGTLAAGIGFRLLPITIMGAVLLAVGILGLCLLYL